MLCLQVQAASFLGSKSENFATKILRNNTTKVLPRLSAFVRIEKIILIKDSFNSACQNMSKGQCHPTSIPSSPPPPLSRSSKHSCRSRCLVAAIGGPRQQHGVVKNRRCFARFLYAPAKEDSTTDIVGSLGTLLLCERLCRVNRGR